MEERLEKQLEFVLEIDKAKSIFRQTHILGHSRRENDAEHAWHMAIMAFLLVEHAKEDVDLLKVILMILVHDLVEIDAGDTYAYDAVGNQDKEEREKAAADRIFSILPQDQGDHIRALWEEFEAEETPESLFAHCMDNFQPLLLNHENGGGDWYSYQVKKSQIMKRNRLTEEGSERIWQKMEALIEENVRKGRIIDE